MIKVVCAYIEKDKNVLIARRADGGESVYCKWEFPGGKIELNETPEEAIQREMMEEFEVNVKASDKMAEVTHYYPEKDVNLSLYRCDYISGEFNIHEDRLEYT